MQVAASARLRRRFMRPALAVLVACVFLAACEHTQNKPSPAAQTTSPQASGGLNKDWGSCQFRRCGYGK